MAILTVQEVDRAGDGLTPVQGAAAVGGDSWVNTGREWVEVENGGGAPMTITFVTPQTISGLGIADLVVTIPAAGKRKVGPFPVGAFVDPANGRTAITYTAVTTVTVGVYRLAAS